MTDRPAPQPLPAPGPPPHPSGWHYTDTQPGPGPKPDGPTGPTPTGPGPQRGHLPIGASGGQLPMLGQVIRDAERLGAQMLSVLDRDYDVASAPSAEDDPTGLGFVEIRILSAIADVRSSLKMLEQITEIGLPPVGSAVQYPARRTPSACLSGGSASHPVRRPGEGLLPGLVAAAPTVHGIDESEATLPGRDAGESFSLPQAKRWTA